MYTLSDFDFDLPQELIAQYPLSQRSSSRLMLVQPSQLTDTHFNHLIDSVNAGDLLVFNNTKVLKARFWGSKQTGGKIEILIERITEPRRAIAKVRSSKSPKQGSIILIDDEVEVKVEGRDGEFFILNFPEDIFGILETHGHLPLPPYIERAADSDDESRYQTVYAKELGAVAAPTAGLHFDEDLLTRLREKGVKTAFLTLHVGAGTFQPVRDEDLSKHHMHSEWYTLDQATVDAVNETHANGGKVFAVGTTSLRALESASRTGTLVAGSAETALFITPGYHFNVVDKLITNFHLPKSTLLMLVSAFAGFDLIKRAYAHAIEQRYRFFSYGDAMLLTRAQDEDVRE